MFRRFLRLVPVVLALFLLAANYTAYDAHAHNWNGYHWDRGGNHTEIDEYNYAVYFSDAEAARVSKWNKIGILYNYRVGSHTDVSVYDGNFGATGWSGLASLEDCCDWDWGCWCWDHISHGHARYNSYYGYSAYSRQYVFCQEVFHTYGFDHDNYGGCMDYNGTTNVLVNHNVNDFYGRYQNH
jgi:hypothetical protein